MNASRSRVVTAVGAAGLVLVGTLAVATFVRGGFGPGQRDVLVNCGPRHPAGQVGNVTLSDRGGAMMGANNLMMVSLDASPNIVSTGTITFVATNVGAMNHEFLVLPAPADGVGTRASGVDGRIDESGSLGEASTSCGAGAGQGISPGATSWVTVTLAPGHYELLCDEPWHYANGMFAGFTVT